LLEVVISRFCGAFYYHFLVVFQIGREVFTEEVDFIVLSTQEIGVVGSVCTFEGEELFFETGNLVVGLEYC
jgi:hypothetical protein